MVLRNFNALLHYKEKFGGLPTPLSEMADFRNYMNDSGLYDLLSNGPKFTWSNQQVDYHITFKIDIF